MTEKNSTEYAKFLSDEIYKALDSKKANDIAVLPVTKQTVLADFFVLANGTSSTHIRALADEVEFKIKENFSIEPAHTEGRDHLNWVLLDYGCVVVHIFTKEAWDFYKLDKLWADSGVSSP